MKTISKEGLFLAGIVFILSIITSYIENDFIDLLYTLTLIAWVCLTIMILFNKAPSFLVYITSNYPRTATYIASLGVITYFWLFYTIFVIMIGITTNVDENSFISPALIWFAENTPYIITLMAIIALLTSFILTMKKKIPN